MAQRLLSTRNLSPRHSSIVIDQSHFFETRLKIWFLFSLTNTVLERLLLVRYQIGLQSFINYTPVHPVEVQRRVPH